MIVTVNGSEVDVVSNEIKPTFQSNTLNNINNRNLPNATLRFPRTPKNALVFDYLDYQGANSRVPYTTTSVVIKIGNEVILDGTLRITKTTDSHYEGMARGKGGDIFDLIKDKKLSDLDFSSFNHYLDNASYAAAVSNTNGYKYALGLFKEEGVESPIDISTQSPLMYKDFLWQLIFDTANIAYTGDIFLDPYYKSELITMAKAQVTTGKPLVMSLPEGSNEIYTSTLATYDLDSTLSPLDSSSAHIDDRIKVSEDGSIEILQKCKIRLVNTFTANVRLTYPSAPSGSNTATFEIKKNGIVIDDNTQTVSITGVAPLWDSLIEHTASFYSLAEAGDIYTFETTSSATCSIMPSSGVTVEHYSSDLYIDILEPYIDFSELIGDMTQTDFIKDVINQYGLLFQVTKLADGELSYDFKPMEEILTDKEGAEDWSDKLSRRISTSTSIGSYGVENEFKYKYHADANRDFNFISVSTNENQKEVGVVVSSIYTMYNDYNYLNIPEYYLFESEINGNKIYFKSLELKNTTCKVVDSSPTVVVDGGLAMINGSLTSIDTYNPIDDGQGGAVDSGNFPALEYLKKVSYKDCQWSFYVTNYFEAFLRILNNPVTEVMEIYLSPLDIEELDFFKLKYVSTTGSYYYLNKVSNYREGYATKCELVKVITE